VDASKHLQQLHQARRHVHVRLDLYVFSRQAEKQKGSRLQTFCTRVIIKTTPLAARQGSPRTASSRAKVLQMSF